jgi:hypothetical protein
MQQAGAHLSIKRGTRGGWRHLDESRVAFDVRDPFFSGAVDELMAVSAELESAGEI